MSKASEWAGAVRAAREDRKPTPFRMANHVNAADIMEDGRLWIHDLKADATDALRLADWLRETFGEPGEPPTPTPTPTRETLCSRGRRGSR